jgi:hypothetical protein
MCIGMKAMAWDRPVDVGGKMRLSLCILNYECVLGRQMCCRLLKQ